MMQTLTIDDLRSLLAVEAREDVHLEFKRSAILIERKANDLSKEICAFANSDGGRIIVGIEEGKTGIALSFDTGTPPTLRAGEWIDQVVSSHIQPALHGVAVDTVDHNGNIIYIINVPRSNRAPHQAQDKRYYKRFGSLSVPMEDYEISDVRSRSSRLADPISISLALRGFIFHLCISNASMSDLSAVEIEFDSNFPEVLVKRKLKNLSLKLLKRGAVAEYALSTGPELFSKNRAPYLSAKFSYTVLGERMAGKEEFHISDYENQVIVRTQEEEYLKSISDALKRISDGQADLIRKIDAIGQAFGGSGIDLSIRSLEYLTGKPLRKYDPSNMDVDGFSEVLGIDQKTSIDLYRTFRYMDAAEINKVLQKLEPDVQDRVRTYFRDDDGAMT